MAESWLDAEVHPVPVVTARQMAVSAHVKVVRVVAATTYVVARDVITVLAATRATPRAVTTQRDTFALMRARRAIMPRLPTNAAHHATTSHRTVDRLRSKLVASIAPRITGSS